jgi:hypothetical protein
MVMSFPKVQELRSRLQARVGAARARVPAGRFMGQGQMRLGGGALVDQARQRADMAARRLAERKPGVIPMVKEFRPGERIRQFLGQREITDLSIERDMSIAGSRPAYPFDGRDMSVFVE